MLEELEPSCNYPAAYLAWADNLAAPVQTHANSVSKPGSLRTAAEASNRGHYRPTLIGSFVKQQHWRPQPDRYATSWRLPQPLGPGA